MKKAVTTWSSRLSAGCAKLLGNAWHGRGAFGRLAAVSPWRVALVECALLALVCGGFYLLRYQASAERYRAALKRTSDELRYVVLELESERRDLRAARERRDLLGSLVLDKEARARLISELSSVSAHPGLEFLAVSPQPERPVGEHVQHRALMALSGNFGDFVGFLRWLEASGTPCALLQVDVESRWDSEKPERFSLLVETYGRAAPAACEQGPVR